MTRLDRLVVLGCYVLAFGLLFVVAAAASANVGPIEFVLMLVLAVPIAVPLSRAARRRIANRQ
jgi:hypothetical protein